MNKQSYLVTWTIDLEAENPEQAARAALDIHRDPESIATCFTVKDNQGYTTEIDLEELEVNT